MNDRNWLIPILIVAVNALAVIVRWSSMTEILPAHFDLQGNASGTMPRNLLLVYPLISAAVTLTAYLIARMSHKLQAGLVILASGISLILLSSTMVTLTSGTMPIFMLVEPVILLATVVACVVSIVRSCKSMKK